MITRTLLRKFRQHRNLILAAGLLLGFAASSAQAVPLNLVLNDSPDIYTDFINFSYNASTKTFYATGSVNDYWDGVTDYTVANGTFTLSGVLDSSNKAIGTIEIDGSLGTGTLGSGILLIGTLTDFGFGAPGGVLEFLFSTTGGDLASAFNSVGGIILSGADWHDIATSTLNTNRVAAADTGSVPVPEPSSAVLLLLGAIGAGMVRIRKNASKA
jgi:hypothetical protein